MLWHGKSGADAARTFSMIWRVLAPARGTVFLALAPPTALRSFAFARRCMTVMATATAAATRKAAPNTPPTMAPTLDEAAESGPPPAGGAAAALDAVATAETALTLTEA
jgi:hypothetical protein